jgi:AraC-like DNA-binding protein
LFRNCESSKKIIEAFPDSWILFFKKNDFSTKIKVQTRDKDFNLDEKSAIFLSPFFLNRWKLSEGTHEWWAYRSTSPLPLSLRNIALIYSWDSSWEFQRADQLIDKLISLQDQARSLSPEFINSDLARKIKEKIDSRFQDDLSLQEIIDPVECSLSTLSHTFKKSFGLCPVQYRNQLRMHSAILKMSYEKYGVTDSCYEAGFNDFSRFYRNMKRYFGASPSSFLRKAKK